MTTSIFLDSSIVNRILDIDKRILGNFTYEEDRHFLRKILDICLGNEEIKLYVNPSVKIELEKTGKELRRKELLAIYERYKILPFNASVYPLIFPFTFISEEDAQALDYVRKKVPGLRGDTKILADAAFSKVIDILLTTDRKHLANKNIQIRNLKIFTPKELFEHLHNAER